MAVADTAGSGLNEGVGRGPAGNAPGSDPRQRYSPLYERPPNERPGTTTAANNAIDLDVGAFGLKAGMPYCTLRFGKYERPKPFTSSDLTYDLTVALPLPNELQDQTGVDYSEKSLETVGDLFNSGFTFSAGAAAGLRHSGGVIQGAMQGASGALGKFGALSGAIGGAMGNAAASLLPAEQMTSAIQQQTGLAPNPNPSLMFEGPQLREFTYSWTFMPDSKTESDNLRNFIRNVKARVLPKVSPGLSPVLFYPHMVQMNFHPWDKDGHGSNPWGWGDNTIIRIKKCVVKSFNVSYTPANVPAFFDGNPTAPHPVAVTCTIQLKELEYMLSNDWGGSDGPSVDLKYLLDRLSRVPGLGPVADKLSDLLNGITAEPAAGSAAALAAQGQQVQPVSGTGP